MFLKECRKWCYYLIFVSNYTFRTQLCVQSIWDWSLFCVFGGLWSSIFVYVSKSRLTYETAQNYCVFGNYYGFLTFFMGLNHFWLMLFVLRCWPCQIAVKKKWMIWINEVLNISYHHSIWSSNVGKKIKF